MLIEIRPSGQQRQTIDIRPTVEVERVPSSYLVEQGWEKKGDKSWEGWYRTIFGSFKGQIRYGKEQNELGWHFYIIDPPTAIFNGRHAGCFVRRGPDKFWIHFSCKPTDLDSGLREAESVITQSMAQERRG